MVPWYTGRESVFVELFGGFCVDFISPTTRGCSLLQLRRAISFEIIERVCTYSSGRLYECCCPLPGSDKITTRVCRRWRAADMKHIKYIDTVNLWIIEPHICVSSLN